MNSKTIERNDKYMSNACQIDLVRIGATIDSKAFAINPALFDNGEIIRPKNPTLCIYSQASQRYYAGYIKGLPDDEIDSSINRELKLVVRKVQEDKHSMGCSGIIYLEERVEVGDLVYIIPQGLAVKPPLRYGRFLSYHAFIFPEIRKKRKMIEIELNDFLMAEVQFINLNESSLRNHNFFRARPLEKVSQEEYEMNINRIKRKIKN